jgi:CheY-like chemotaxis protein
VKVLFADSTYGTAAIASSKQRTALQKPDIHIDVVLSDMDMPGKMNGQRRMRWNRARQTNWGLASMRR